MKAIFTSTTTETTELLKQYNLFAAKEPVISNLIRSISEILGVELAGWDFRLKTWSSAYEKVVVRKEEDDIASMKDVVRYTFLVDEDSFGTSVNEILTELKDRGIEILKLKNYWLDANSAYNGVNTQVLIESTAVEIQFHTPDSLRVKEELNHPLYNKVRDPRLDDLERAAVQRELEQIGETQRRPQGFELVHHVNWSPFQ